jgi:glycosyltransferase involved in cell wall biosynthesis
MTLEKTLDELQNALVSPDASRLEQVARRLAERYPRESVTVYAQAELFRRRGEVARAFQASAALLAGVLGQAATTSGQIDLVKVFGLITTLAEDEVRRINPFVAQFGLLLAHAPGPHRLEPILGSLAARFAGEPGAATLRSAHAIAVLAFLGFTSGSRERWAVQVFETVVVPWIIATARAGNFDTALLLESIAYEEHVKRVESQAWFKATTSRWIPALAAASRAHAPGQRHAAWRPEPVRRIAFFVHGASMLAHVAVLIETLQAVREIGARNYEFTVFVATRRSAELEQALARCGVRLQYLEQRAGMGLFERLLVLERFLAEDNYAACFWVSFITIMAVAFTRRIAPIQGWWAMKYHACDIEEIDVHLAVESAVSRKVMEGIEWRTLGTASTRWVDPSKSAAAGELRASFPAEAVVAASIGREEKLDSPEFLAAVSRLLRRHPRLYFLWTGKSQRGSIVSHFEREGVGERARFVGWVDTRLYAQAIDLFLDSFPFPCGFTLKEAMAAGKPAVMFRSPESLETGVPGAITPVIEGPPGAENAAVRERMRSIFTRERDFDLYFCAANAQEYFDCADRLIADALLRRDAGAANRRFVETFLSSPREEAKKFLDHLDEIFAPTGAQPRITS